MGRNIEIKARVEANEFAALRSRAELLATDGPIELIQEDTFFQTQNGRLKLREFADGTAEFIFYERQDSDGPKTSTYIRSECVCPASMKASLEKAVGICETVKKHREVFFIDQTRVHLDNVEGLGTFVELEVVMRDGQTESEGQAIANELMQSLEISNDQLVSGAYADLIKA